MVPTMSFTGVDSTPSEQQLAIAWIDLSFYGDSFGFRIDSKRILNKLKGRINFGSLTALMGPSGCGKSTLLKCINGQNKTGLGEKTQIYVSKERSIKSCFIVQDEKEHLLMGLTGRESLIYASKLKNSLVENNIDHWKNASTLMDDLMISDTANTLVGNCSGGEQKRLAIGMELTSLIKPNLICIDEPTSGLDSNAADLVMKCLKDVCQVHKISIVTSIHQPNADILLMFDQLYVLSKGGMCVFSNSPLYLSQHLAECGIECTQSQIPIEVLLKIATKGVQEEKVISLANKTSRENTSMRIGCESNGTLVENGIELKSKDFRWIDLWYLLNRSKAYTLRSQWKLMLSQLIIVLSIGFILPNLYDEDIAEASGCFSFTARNNNTCSQISEQIHEQDLLQQSNTFIFFGPNFMNFINMIMTTLTFTSEVKIFMNEHRNGWYSTGAYYFAKSIMELPLWLLISSIYSLITFFSSGQANDGNRLVGWILVHVASAICVQGLVFLIGILTCKTPKVSLVLSVGTFLAMMIFCDFFSPLKELNYVFQLISHLSYAKHCLHSLILILYGFNRCLEGELQYFLYDLNLKDEDIVFHGTAIILFIICTRGLALTALIIIADPSSKKRMKSASPSQVGPLDEIEEMFNVANGEQDTCPETCIEINNLENIAYIQPPNIMEDQEAKSLALAWLNLSFTGDKPLNGKAKTILDQVNGQLNLGTINALMGPSGCGKSTFMKCINGRHKAGLNENTLIYVNKNRPNFSSCFIVQEPKEHLIFGLSGRETLNYAYKLKNSGEKGSKNNDSKEIDKLMTDLMINDIENTLVEKCSGGQQKRLTIAMELTSNKKPDLIALDEPTSGLDSNSAEVVIKCLKNVARKHEIVILTSIHQPNADVLMMFDSVYVLAKGGKCVFSDSPSKLALHLNNCGINCEEWQIPIEILLKTASLGTENVLVERLWHKTFEKCSAIMDKCREEALIKENGIEFKDKMLSRKDFWVLLERNSVYLFRSQWKALLIQFFYFLMIGGSLSQMFNENMGKANGCFSLVPNPNATCVKSAQQIQEETFIVQNMKNIGFTILVLNFLLIVSTTSSIPSDIRVFLNEHDNGWYSSGSYYWSKTLVELPLPITIGISLALISFFGSGQVYDCFRLMTFILFLLIGALQAQSVGVLAGTLFAHSEKLAIIVAVSWFMIAVSFSGFFTPIQKMHVAIRHLSHASWLKHPFLGLIIAIYGFNRCPDDQVQLMMFQFNLEDDDLWPFVKIALLHILVYRIMGLVALIYSANRGNK